ncbi:hypothetical protein [Streptomyces mutabilis]
MAPGTQAARTSQVAVGSKVVGYYTEWGTYDRKYHVMNVETSGSGAELTHINHAFGNVTGGKCAMAAPRPARPRARTRTASRTTRC